MNAPRACWGISQRDRKVPGTHVQENQAERCHLSQSSLRSHIASASRPDSRGEATGTTSAREKCRSAWKEGWVGKERWPWPSLGKDRLLWLQTELVRCPQTVVGGGGEEQKKIMLPILPIVSHLRSANLLPVGSQFLYKGWGFIKG